jgi:hypothetical protein
MDTKRRAVDGEMSFEKKKTCMFTKFSLFENI